VLWRLRNNKQKSRKLVLVGSLYAARALRPITAAIAPAFVYRTVTLLKKFNLLEQCSVPGPLFTLIQKWGDVEVKFEGVPNAAQHIGQNLVRVPRHRVFACDGCSVA
jgi:hypothetical protein